MNARFLVSGAAILPLSLLAISCSSEAKPVTSGGAQFQLQNPTAADRGMLGTCLDPSTEPLFVAQRGEDGQLKLVVNGADDSRVSCRADAGRFNVSVSRQAASFAASGTIVPASGDCAGVPGAMAMSTDAFVLISAPSNNNYKTITKKCRICFTQNSDAKIRGNVFCPLLEHTTLSNACATTDSGAAATFFSFANCEGF